MLFVFVGAARTSFPDFKIRDPSTPAVQHSSTPACHYSSSPSQVVLGFYELRILQIAAQKCKVDTRSIENTDGFR